MRRHRADDNQKAILAALRKAGWLAVSLSGVGEGVPDILAYKPSQGVRLVEVKNPATWRGKVLTADQVVFHGKGWPVSVIRSVDEALSL